MSHPGENRDPTTPSDYQQLQQLVQQHGILAGLEHLENWFRQHKQYPQLFEILKMRCRVQLGLPLIHGTQPEQLDDATQQQLEQGLIEACYEVGMGLLAAGELERGWLYLQPIGNRPSVEATLQNFPVTDENIETIIEICLGQSAAPAYGYQLVIQHFGICDGITTFDVQSPRFERKIQQHMAEILLRRFYDELRVNLVHLIRREGLVLSELAADAFPENKTLPQLFEDYPALRGDSVHVIDATHLVSVIRIARILTSQEDLSKAWELCQYGKQLHPDFHYPCPVPFESTFEDHSIFYAALLGEEIALAVGHFQQKFHSLDRESQDLAPLGTLIELLNRTGQRSTALQILLTEISGNPAAAGMVSSLFQIPRSEEEWQLVRGHFQSQGDFLSFGISLLQEHAAQNG